MLARRLTTLLPAMTNVESHRHHPHPHCGRPHGQPHHTISEVGLIGGDQVPMPGDAPLDTMGCSFWMSCQSSDATSWRSCASPQEVCSIDTIFRLRLTSDDWGVQMQPLRSRLSSSWNLLESCTIMV
jgi:hypothetical protein